jgi:type III secretion protein L
MTTALQHRIAPLGRIIRAEDVGLYRDAVGALRAAEAAAAEDRAAAIAAIEADTAARRDATAQQIQQEHVRILAETAAVAQRSIAGLRREIAEAIAEGIARVIGGIDLADAVARAAQRAVAELAAHHAVVVHVNPLAHDRVAARLGAHHAVQVVADATLPQDDCIVETPAGFVRAGLQQQLETLRTALIEAADNA